MTPIASVDVEQPLRLLTVHAHPDDEASKGAGTVARYAEEGIEATLVCCTGGEAGDVLNPALDTPEVHADLAAVRRAELARSVEIIGYARWEMLGYRDSGMADSPTNDHPECFAQAPLDDAAIAALLNWLLPRMDADGLPDDFQPYTAAEVAHLRATRPGDVPALRQRALDEVAALEAGAAR